MINVEKPVCKICEDKAELVTGKVIYPNLPSLHRKNYWRCKRCDSWVGCHNGTTIPLGSLANKSLRTIRTKAHRVFDQLWHDPSPMSRTQAYKWLANELKISESKCHIGMMDYGMCAKVINVCETKLGHIKYALSK